MDVGDEHLIRIVPRPAGMQVLAVASIPNRILRARA
jgi:hypothetical protein